MSTPILPQDAKGFHAQFQEAQTNVILMPSHQGDDCMNVREGRSILVVWCKLEDLNAPKSHSALPA